MRLLSPLLAALLIELGLFLVLALYDWLRTGAFPPIVVILHQTQWFLALIVALYLLVRYLVSLRSHGPPADADRQWRPM